MSSNLSSRHFRPALRMAALAGTIALVLGAAQFATRDTQAASQPATPAAPVAAVTRTGTPHFADLIEQVQPAVVNIATTRKAKAGPAGTGMNGRPANPNDPQMREFLERFFGGQMPGGGEGPSREVHAAGSGFVVDAQGYIVTNNHVIDEADEIMVTFHDGTRLEAKLAGRDPKTDLALLKVEPRKPLTAVALGDSDGARVGDWVIAIGNPFGLGGTATAGIISARGRDIQSGPYDDYLQVDAPINQGNSGGPIFDEGGRVIGVNTMIYSPNGGSVGIGFAIPASTVAHVIGELRADGKVDRGWLGVQIQGLDEDMAASLGLEDTHGALIADVVAGSPAQKAGLKAGDVVRSYDGKPIKEARELSRAVAATADGTSAGLDVMRDGKSLDLTVRIAKLDEGNETQLAGNDAGNTGGDLGLRLAPASEQGAEGEGALVMGVRPGSAAAELGLAEGDIIRQVGAAAVKSPADVSQAVKQARAADRKSVLLLVERDGRRSFVPLALS
jgi:serine protease Do